MDRQGVFVQVLQMIPFSSDCYLGEDPVLGLEVWDRAGILLAVTIYYAIAINHRRCRSKPTKELKKANIGVWWFSQSVSIFVPGDGATIWVWGPACTIFLPDCSRSIVVISRSYSIFLARDCSIGMRGRDGSIRVPSFSGSVRTSICLFPKDAFLKYVVTIMNRTIQWIIVWIAPSAPYIFVCSSNALN